MCLQVGHEELVRYLLAKGASVKDADDMGHTPLLCAVSENRTNIVELLLNEGRPSLTRPSET